MVSDRRLLMMSLMSLTTIILAVVMFAVLVTGSLHANRFHEEANSQYAASALAKAAADFHRGH